MAGKVLIVDDVATNRIVLKVKLSAARYETILAATGRTALELMRRERPDLVLLDVQLPDIDGIELCRMIRADPFTAHLPVVMVSATDTPEVRLAALRAGATDFMRKPLDELQLLARLRSLLRNRESEEELRLRESTCRELGFAEPAATYTPASSIALVAAKREQAMAWRRVLAPHLRRATVRVLGREDVLSLSGESQVPDAFVVAADLTREGDGLRLVSELRARLSTRHRVIVAAISENARETAATALDIGADDHVATDEEGGLAAPEEVALRLMAQLDRQRTANRLRGAVADGLRLAVTDPLTGLYNRRYAQPQLTRMAARAASTGQDFAVMLLDIDRFKSVNDTYGHAAGDAVLTEIAHRLRVAVGEDDLIARIGGEEFLIALADTTAASARLMAERIRGIISQTPVSIPGETRRITVSASIGLAIAREDHSMAIDRLTARADGALRSAKACGRNRVTVSTPATAA